jgi:hypothetical protein
LDGQEEIDWSVGTRVKGGGCRQLKFGAD